VSPDQRTASWEALGTTALVRVTEAAALPAAREIVAAELARIDRAASRFRADSELVSLSARGGRTTRISSLLAEAIAVALRAAELTGGAVDPTLGAALRLAGYDRDYDRLEHAPHGDPAPQPPTLSLRRVSGWREIVLRRDPPTVLVPAGMELDLGATAKALAADRAVAAVAEETGTGALVALGGDISVAGEPPPQGWQVRVVEDHRAGAEAPGQTVAIDAGGLATSSTTTRRWRHGETIAHHILDPGTGRPSTGPWRTVSVTAACCVDANIASTAAIVLGAGAVSWLEAHGLPARLVDAGGEVSFVGGWPPGGA
jgi:thiamine biosynthesis lipoprotein